MSALAWQIDHSTPVTFDVVSPPVEQRADMRELSPEELEDVSGGMLPLLVVGAFAVGYAMGFYHGYGAAR